MTATRHAAVRADPAAPCPFCGSGGTALAQLAPRPRAVRSRRARFQLTPVPLDALPAWWRAFFGAPLVRREPSAEELRVLAKLAAMRGQAVTVDERDNSVRAA